MIRSRKHLMGPGLVLAALAGALPSSVHAQETERRVSASTAADVVVTGQRRYRADTVSSPKFTQEIINTPQTLTVITGQVLADQGALSLAEALRNTPGITLQLGENGNTSSGDAFTMRGFSVESAIFQDGIRDLGATTRDVFNVEQVEVAKGPAGSDIGRGASGGYINQASKTPKAMASRSLGLSASSEGGWRATGDVNQPLGETTAVRLNVFGQNLPTVGRDEVEKTGYGIAPAIAFGVGTATEFQLFGQHVVQNNIPDGAIPSIGVEGFFNASAVLRAGARVDERNFYGSVNDYEDTESNMLTARVIHNAGEQFTITNTSRYGRTDMDRVLTGINTLTAPSTNPATWTVSRSRQRVDQVNEILANQTILVSSFTTGAVKHDISTGVEALYESQESRSFAAIGAIPAAPLYNPSSNINLEVPRFTGAQSDGSTVTVGAFLFDTINLDEKLFLSGGVRVETYRTETDAIVVSTAAANPTLPVGTLAPSALEDDGTLTSWKVGAVYKPAPAGSIYVAFANSAIPPGSTNFTLSASGTSVANAAFDPQETESLEAGVKWQLFGDRLLVTGAYYSTTNQNELTLTDPVTQLVEQLGERTVKGFEFSAVGTVTDRWSVTAGVQTLETEVTQGTTGNTTTGSSARWSPELTATVWSTYDFTDKLTLGAGVRYIGEQDRIVVPGTDLSTQTVPVIPDYWVADGLARYNFTRNVSLQLNVYNVFDEDYIYTLNNSGARLTPGAPRSAYVTLAFNF